MRELGQIARLFWLVPSWGVALVMEAVVHFFSAIHVRVIMPLNI